MVPPCWLAFPVDSFVFDLLVYLLLVWYTLTSKPAFQTTFQIMGDAEEFPVFDEPVKVFIRDVHRLEQHASERNFYLFHGKRIRKVDIMGVVTEVRQLQNAHLYRVDDGTGEILCRYNHHSAKTVGELNELERLQDLVANRNYVNPSHIGEAMEHIVEETLKKSSKETESLEQGNIAHIQGFISDFHGTHEIRAFTLCKVSCSEDEIDRIFEMSFLYSTLYNQLRD